MATTVYARNSAVDIAGLMTHLGTNLTNLVGTATTWQTEPLQTTRGTSTGALSTATVAGTTLGLEVLTGSDSVHWISDPVDADVTISGAITGNIWASESSMNANVAINFVVDVIRATDNAIVQIVKSARVTEVAVTTRAVNNFTATPGAGVLVNKGDRLRIRIFGDDAGTMGSGFTFSVGFGGPTAAADGDTFFTFTETFGFLTTDPTGSQLFLTTVDAEVITVEDSDWITDSYGTSDRAGNTAWSNPGNASASDDSYASVTSAASDYLWSSHIFSIPTNRVIRGVEVEIESKSNASPFLTANVSLGNEEGGVFTPNGQTKQFIVTATDNIDKVGSPTDVWANPLTHTEMNDDINHFAVGVWHTTADTWEVDRIRIKVYYGTIGNDLLAWTSRGSGVFQRSTQGVTGWVSPISWRDIDSSFEWYTRPLTTFTLTGLAKGNVRLSEAADINASARVEIARVNADGTSPTVWCSWCLNPLAGGGIAGELSSTQTVETFWLSGDDLVITNGQRLRFRVYLEDMPTAPLGASGVGVLYWNGTTGGASGDTFITLPQTLTEFVHIGAWQGDAIDVQIAE